MKMNFPFDFRRHIWYNKMDRNLILIDVKKIQKNLTTKIIGRKFFTFDSIDSTNTYAKKLSADELHDGTLVIAEEQTLGHGRFNRKWESEHGKNLTFSVILQPSNPINILGLLPICTGGVIAKSIEYQTKLMTECKWPNDILIDAWKVCGILIESTSAGRVIIGIGINVNQECFSEEIKHSASSLKLLSGRQINRIELLACFLNSLEEMYKDFRAGNYHIPLNDWYSRSKIFGNEIKVLQSDKEIKGTALRLDTDGGLVLNCNGKEVTIYSGDVTLIKQLQGKTCY
jgi:BirA family transcriptional regulator, biotin operon repressor / biotin---[acetyl-CoA-carboxylase] ligase